MAKQAKRCVITESAFSDGNGVAHWKWEKVLMVWWTYFNRPKEGICITSICQIWLTWVPLRLTPGWKDGMLKGAQKGQARIREQAYLWVKWNRRWRPELLVWCRACSCSAACKWPIRSESIWVFPWTNGPGSWEWERRWVMNKGARRWLKVENNKEKSFWREEVAQRGKVAWEI